VENFNSDLAEVLNQRSRQNETFKRGGFRAYVLDGLMKCLAMKIVLVYYRSGVVLGEGLIKLITSYKLRLKSRGINKTKPIT